MASPNQQHQHPHHHHLFLQQQQQQQQQQPPFDMHHFFMPHQQPPPPPQQQQQSPPHQQPPSSSYPPPSGPHFSPLPYLSSNPNPNPNPNPNNFSNIHPQRSLSFPTPPLQPPPLTDRSGAELMALLRTSPLPSPPPPLQHDLPSPLPPMRMQSGKVPRGRRVSGDHVVYDTAVRFPGEAQPQLEVTPITKYNSDPQLCLGRQIAVNKSYICYGLKQGNVRILNINTALRSLFRTQSQRVTDMALFAEDVHLLASAGIDGRINVWKISEGPDEEDKPQITGRIVMSIQIVGEEEIRNPRVCWHCYKQEILVVGVGKRVLKIDTNKVGKSEVYSPEAPLQCPVDKLVDGVQIVGKHDGEVTDLSMCQWMTTRLVSASMDGTIKIWEDIKALPLAVLRPYDGQPVYSSTFLTAPNRPDHIILITAGPQNQEVKVWSSTREEGWLLPGDSENLNCTQTLELKSSSEPGEEEAFFNQVLALSQVGVLLLANAKRNAIYAIHLEYGPNPASTRMDYISEFSVTMPILSLTGTSDVLHGQSVAQIYCVQTQAIQQYTLDLCQCLPPPLDNNGAEKPDSSVSLSHDASNNEGFISSDSHASKLSDVPLSSVSTDTAPLHDVSQSNMDSKALPMAPSASDADNIKLPASSPRSSGSGLSRDVTEVGVVARNESGGFSNDHGVNRVDIDYSVDQQIDTNRANLSDTPPFNNNSRTEEKKVAQDEILCPSVTFKHPTHLVTPSEILMAVTSSEVTNYNDAQTKVDTNIHDVIVNSDVSNAEVEVKEVGETQPAQNGDFGFQGDLKKVVPENREKYFCSQASGLGMEMTRDCPAISTENVDPWQNGDVQEFLAQPSEVHTSVNDVSGKVAESSVNENSSLSSTPTTSSKRQKGKNQAMYPLSPSPSNFNSTDFSGEPGVASGLSSVDAAFSQISAMQEMLNQVLTNQKEMQKQMSNMIAVPVSKECRKLEAALGRNIEKALKANSDVLWARFQEENAKNEKSIRERMQQMSSLISNFINKDFANVLEKSLKKELSSVGQSVARTLSPIVEKVISSAIAESFQRGVGDKAVNQLEKSVNSKLEATVARQIQAQFQTSGKQALQEGLRSGLEASVIPAFEMSCKAMFEQVDSSFRKGMQEHTAAAQRQFESANSPLALSLREAINSASSLTRTLSGELAENQRKLLALAAAGANPGATKPMVTRSSDGILSGLFDKVEMPVDPIKEISRLSSEGKFEEAFTVALQRSDVSVVSWLCSQVDLRGILSMVPLPLSQGVLLSLLQQLACDINKETSRKLEWMTDVAAAMNPSDQMIVVHVRPILEQVYQILQYQQSVPARTGAEISSIRVLMHVINSLIRTCK